MIRLPSGADHLVQKSSLRDSTHSACVAQPGLFTTTPPTVADVGVLMWQRLQAAPAGTEV